MSGKRGKMIEKPTRSKKTVKRIAPRGLFFLVEGSELEEAFRLLTSDLKSS